MTSRSANQIAADPADSIDVALPAGAWRRACRLLSGPPLPHLLTCGLPPRDEPDRGDAERILVDAGLADLAAGELTARTRFTSCIRTIHTAPVVLWLTGHRHAVCSCAVLGIGSRWAASIARVCTTRSPDAATMLIGDFPWSLAGARLRRSPHVATLVAATLEDVLPADPPWPSSTPSCVTSPAGSFCDGTPGPAADTPPRGRAQNDTEPGARHLGAEADLCAVSYLDGFDLDGDHVYDGSVWCTEDARWHGRLRVGSTASGRGPSEELANVDRSDVMGHVSDGLLRMLR